MDAKLTAAKQRFIEFDDVLTSICQKTKSKLITLQQASWEMVIACHYLFEKEAPKHISSDPLRKQLEIQADDDASHAFQSHAPAAERAYENIRNTAGAQNHILIAINASALRVARLELITHVCHGFWMEVKSSTHTTSNP
jgi:hypothetical protein